MQFPQARESLSGNKGRHYSPRRPQGAFESVLLAFLASDYDGLYASLLGFACEIRMAPAIAGAILYGRLPAEIEFCLVAHDSEPTRCLTRRAALAAVMRHPFSGWYSRLLPKPEKSDFLVLI